MKLITYVIRSDITWSSSDNRVARVNNGILDAISKGSTIITAKSGSESVTTTVNVVSPDIKISLEDGLTLTLKVKKKIKRFNVSNENIIRVKKKGKKIKVTGLQRGMTSLTAYGRKGKILGRWYILVE